MSWERFHKQAVPASPGRLRAQRRQLAKLIAENIRPLPIPSEAKCPDCGYRVSVLTMTCAQCGRVI